MQRIKVTGYMQVDELNDEDVDLEHTMGLSTLGYDKKYAMFSNVMEDVEFELVDE